MWWCNYQVKGKFLIFNACEGTHLKQYFQNCFKEKNKIKSTCLKISLIIKFCMYDILQPEITGINDK